MQTAEGSNGFGVQTGFDAGECDGTFRKAVS